MTSSTSPEFLELCQAQVKILTKSLNAAWTVIYLTENFLNNHQGKLNPIVVYPQNKKFWSQDISPLSSLQFLSPSQSGNNLLSLPYQDQFNEDNFLESNNDLSINNISNNEKENITTITSGEENKQIMLPLIYKDSVMGLIIVGRNDRKWNNTELEQIENIANTLAIACFLDHSQGWYQKQLLHQKKITLQQQDYLDTLLHQLKNPITALRTFSKLLLKRFLPQNSNYDIAQGILQESNRLQDLVGNFQREIIDKSPSMLSPSTKINKIEYNKEESSSTSFLLTGNNLNLQPIFLEEFFSNLVFSCDAIAEEKQIEFNYNFSLEKYQLHSIKGDIQALREIFNNLIDNALKYTPVKGSVYLELGLEKRLDNKDFQGVAIHDNGYGIPPQDREHIFERHYRGEKEEGDIPGSGLGLAIVKELVEKMDGKIVIYSPNLYFKKSNLPGTTIIVWLLQNDY